MIFTSTRDKSLEVTFSQAILEGLAPDGGLFVPKNFPNIKLVDFDELETIPEIAKQFLGYFIDEGDLKENLPAICEKAFSFKIPLIPLDKNTHLLELYHGPTGAFKDVGARFLAQCLEYIDTRRTVLVATSGDTGSAVASAFYGLNNVNVAILFPKDKISDFQEMQLTCWDGNIISLKVRSDFDACQKMVKDAFRSDNFVQYKLTSANSINIGRLLPQCVYYVAASLWYSRKHGNNANFIIPTGNMGNALAGIWVKFLGFPIDRIILSCNSNDVIPKYFESNTFESAPSKQTLANAMDVGNPSNFERYIDLLNTNNVTSESLQITAFSVDDDRIKTSIFESKKIWNKIICPHTATATYIQHKQKLDDAIIVATAHPSKFREVVEPIIHQQIEIPNDLQKLSHNPRKFIEIDPLLESVAYCLQKFGSI